MTFENIANLMFECFLLENTTDASDAQVHIVGDAVNMSRRVKKINKKALPANAKNMPEARLTHESVRCWIFIKPKPEI